MVRCDVCGKEVLAGWICGIVPAHDSDKLGLCPEHDTPTNREHVRRKWEDMLQEQLGRTLALEHEDNGVKPGAYHVTIHWLGGGVQRFFCRAWDVNQDGDLLLLKKDLEIDFYPLQHIRRFSVEEAPSGGDPAPDGGQGALPPAHE